MKKQIKETPKENTIISITNRLIAGGMTEMGAEMFLHVNIPALGNVRSILNCIEEDKWDEAWAAVEAYQDGDYF